MGRAGQWVKGAAVSAFLWGVSGVRGLVGGIRRGVGAVVGFGGRHRWLSGFLVLILVLVAVRSVGGDYRRFDEMVVCEDVYESAVGSVPDVGIDASVDETAAKVYEFFHAWGLPDISIAGILSNWMAESNITSFRYEGVYDREAINEYMSDSVKMDRHVRNVLWPDYEKKGISINKNYYIVDGVAHPGIGLGQWTGARHVALVDFAESSGRSWGDLGTQLAFMVSGDSQHYIKILDTVFREGNFSSPKEAAYQFEKQWEGSTFNAAGHQATADLWFSRMPLKSSDPGFAPSIINIAGNHKDKDKHDKAERAVAESGCVPDPCGDGGGSGLSLEGWSNPAVGSVTSPWNPRRIHPIKGIVSPHHGTDVAAPGGSPIYAAHDGTVVKVGWNPGGAGNYVLLDHGEGVMTAYLHMPRHGEDVVEGQKVRAGEKIGVVGSTGASTGNHLHFEVRMDADAGTYWQSKSVDPVPFMSERGISLGVGGEGKTGGSSGGLTCDVGSGMTASRRELVEFARQFLGTPYVWGGKTPDGWDCSGYVGYVYQHFGYDIPPQTDQMDTWFKEHGTKEVSEADAQPGDIILWKGHVMIYTGPNSALGAQNKNIGTVETDFHYRSGARFFSVLDEDASSPNNKPDENEDHD